MFTLARRPRKTPALTLVTPWEDHQSPQKLVISFLQTALAEENSFVFTAGFYERSDKAQLSLSIFGDAEPLLLRDHHTHDEFYQLSLQEQEVLKREVEELFDGPAPTLGAAGFWIFTCPQAAELLRVLQLTV